MSLYGAPYKLNGLIPKHMLNWEALSRNPNAIELLLENYDKINWSSLSTNMNAIDILKNNFEKIDWGYITRNENLIEIIPGNVDKFKNPEDWYHLSKNKSVINIFQNFNKIIDWHCSYWDSCIYNEDGINLLIEKFKNEKIFCWWDLKENPQAIKFLYENLDKVNWNNLSNSIYAIDLLKTNLNKLDDWYNISSNSNAIEILKDNFEKIDWVGISKNSNAIQLLLNNQEKINLLALANNLNVIKIIKKNKLIIDKFNKDCWHDLSANPGIFEIDYNKIKMRINPFKEELISVSMCPSRFKKYLYDYNYDLGEDIYLQDE